MAFQLRSASQRGHFDFGWLNTYHSFSFGDYVDPDYNGFRVLRVLNDDRVSPGQGFGTHGHRDMEIVTYVLSGVLRHEDSMGNGSLIRRGDIQRMSAGTGVKHSEENPSAAETVHLLQIWFLPNEKNVFPGYEQITIPDSDKQNRLCLMVTSMADNTDLPVVRVHQDVKMFATLLSEGQTVQYNFPPDRYGWLHVATGGVTVQGHILKEGDGGSISPGTSLEITAPLAAECLLFDLP